MNRFIPKNRFAPSKGFTILEVLVAVTLMSVIVFAMVAMFDLVQKSFRTGQRQAGVFEPGRATLEMVSTDLEQLDQDQDGAVSLYLRFNPYMDPNLRQNLKGGERKDYYTQDHFSMRFVGNKWIGTGYRLIPPGKEEGIEIPNTVAGTLYRFSVTNANPYTTERNALLLLEGNPNEPAIATNLNVVAEGIVNFSLLPLDGQGNTITNAPVYNSNNRTWTFHEVSGTSNSLPAYLEFELAFLNPDAMKKVKLLPTRDSITNFLNDRPQLVHLFKRRIPVLTAPREK